MRNTLLLLLLWCSAEAQLVNDKYWKWVKTDKKDCKYYVQNTPNDVLYATWTGGCKDGLVDGEGELKVFAKTSPKYGGSYVEYTYTGTLTLGKMTGKGERFYNTTNYTRGTYAEGQLVNGIYVSGSEYYEGEFKHELLNGKGFKLNRDSVKHFGSFVNNNLDGKGLIIFANGDTLRGVFKSKRVTQSEYIYKADGVKFVGTHEEEYLGYKPIDGQLYQGGAHVADLEAGNRVAIRPKPKESEKVVETPVAKPKETASPTVSQAAQPQQSATKTDLDGNPIFTIKLGNDTYVGPLYNGKPYGRGIIYLENGDTAYASFDKEKLVTVLKYITANRSWFRGEYDGYKPSNGKFYRDSKFMFEIQNGKLKPQPVKETSSSQDPLYKTYGSGSPNYKSETKTDPYANYAKGVLFYKGVSNYDLVIEVQAEARYKVKKAPGILSFNYIDVAEAKGLRFRYPGNSNTWYSFGSGDYMYDCGSGKCVSIQGMGFELSSPYLP